MTVEKQMSFVHAPLEGGAIVHFNSLYYALGFASHRLARQS